VDDIKENLKTAHEFGLFTIWLTNQKENPKFIDKKISQLSDLITD
jgi:FMN phosphatase YigB (HAD superfamily)